jgi:hypothetical protein
LRNWKYCTVSAPWATACIDWSMWTPGRWSLATGRQLVADGEDSMSMNGLPLRLRVRSWLKEASTPARTSRSVSLHCG